MPGYRPWLDGVRAVAVLMVVVQHTLGSIPVDLGFVGVGLFFGLSGYLITSLLLDETAVRGTVSLSKFYLRRAARLVPALVGVVLVCNTLFLIQHELRPLLGSFAALTYTANYVLVLKPDAVPGYGPTWSLAVEEHFYLIWPLVLLWVTRRSGLRVALKATLAVCVGAFALRIAWAVAGGPYDLLALGSLERADALLYGCAAAIALRIGWRPHPSIVWIGVSGVIVLPLAFRHENYVALTIGNAFLGIVAAALVVGLDYAAPRWVQRCFSTRWVVTVGVISYGIYLWHGPLMRVAANFGFAGREWRAVVALVSIAVAGVSHHYLEAPVRSWARRRTGRPAVVRQRRDRIVT